MTQSKTTAKLSFETVADSDHIGEINDFVECALDEFGVENDDRGHICVAVDEAVTNVALYAYPNANGNVKITLERIDNRVVVTIVDYGVSFNPLSHPAPDTSASIEQRPIGGLGIHLMRNMTDKMHYRRAGGANYLTLEKNIGG